MREQLQDIDGVGPKTTEKIMSIVTANTSEGVDRRLVQRAYDKLQSGREDLAADALERALED